MILTRWNMSILLCGLFILVSGCLSQDEVGDKDNKYLASTNEVLKLSNQNNNEDGPVVSAISLLTTDSDGNIYLVDPSTLQIHSYTDDLTYRWSVGGRGRGPGKYNRITALEVNNELYVYDNTNSKVVQYDKSGKLLNEWTFGEAGHRITSIDQNENSNIITTGWNEEKESLVNIYDTSFKKRIYSIVNGDVIYQTDHPQLEKQVLRNFPGHAIALADSSILYAPAAYEGTLLKYSQISDQGWKLAIKLKGYNPNDSPLSFHFTQDGEHKRSHLSGFNPEGGYFHTEFKVLSHGLFWLDNNQIVHISTRLREDDTWDAVLEYFNPNSLELTDIQIINEFILRQQPQRLPIWIDKKGRIYMTENSDTPLRILEIGSSKKDDTSLSSN